VGQVAGAQHGAAAGAQCPARRPRSQRHARAVSNDNNAMTVLTSAIFAHFRIDFDIETSPRNGNCKSWWTTPERSFIFRLAKTEVKLTYIPN
jgi:hypothetical protein